MTSARYIIKERPKETRRQNRPTGFFTALVATLDTNAAVCVPVDEASYSKIRRKCSGGYYGYAHERGLALHSHITADHKCLYVWVTRRDDNSDKANQ